MVNLATFYPYLNCFLILLVTLYKLTDANDEQFAKISTSLRSCPTYSCRATGTRRPPYGGDLLGTSSRCASSSRGPQKSLQRCRSLRGLRKRSAGTSPQRGADVVVTQQLE